MWNGGSSEQPGQHSFALRTTEKSSS